jgi:hypothetical protein
MANDDEPGKAPPLMGRANRQWLAFSFDSKDGTIEGVADKFQRARLRARIRFQNRAEEFWRRELCFDNGSPDGSVERLPPENRDAVLLEIHHDFADVQAECLELLKRPALLAGEVDELELLNPFKES